MKIVPKNAPTMLNPSGARAEPQVSARDRAIQALVSNVAAPQAAANPPSVPQEALPVQNATQVSPEELGALKSSSSTPTDGLTGTTEAVEAPKAEAAAPKEEPISNQYAILARKEKALRAKAAAQEQALKAREEALKAKEASLETQYKSQYIPKERLSDPNEVIKTLNELGLSYDQLTEAALNAPKPEQVALMNQIKGLEEQIKALKGDQESTKKTFEESQKQAYTQALSQIERDVRELVSSDPAFEAVKATNSVKDVVKLIERTFNEDGILMSIEEAAQMVEEYKIEEAYKYAKLEKIKKKLESEASKPTETKQPIKQTQEAPTLKTLTNAVSASRKLSSRDRAIAAFKGQKIE